MKVSCSLLDDAAGGLGSCLLGGASHSECYRAVYRDPHRLSITVLFSLCFTYAVDLVVLYMFLYSYIHLALA